MSQPVKSLKLIRNLGTKAAAPPSVPSSLVSEKKTVRLPQSVSTVSKEKTPAPSSKGSVSLDPEETAAVLEVFDLYYKHGREDFLKAVKTGTLSLSGFKALAKGFSLKPKGDAKQQEERLERRARNRAQDLTPFLGKEEVKGILDIGGGDGTISRALGKQVKAKAVYVIDQKVREVRGVSYLAYGKDSSIPLKDKSVDVVLMIMTYHHIPPEGRANLLQEVSRILTPNGRVLIREHDCPHPDEEKKTSFTYMENLIHYVHSVANQEEEYPAEYLSAKTLNVDMGLAGFSPAFSAARASKQARTAQRTYYNAFLKKDLVVEQAVLSFFPSKNVKEEKEQRQWLQTLLNQVEAILGPEFSHPSLIPMWARSMTDESWDLTDNWDSMEFLGRSLLSSLATLYILVKVPGLNESQYTDFRKQVTSKELLEKFATRLGLLNLVRRRDLGVNSGFSYKVFCAFLGGIYLASSSEDLGIEECQRLLFSLLNEEDITERWYEVNAVTQLTQLFSVLGENESVFETSKKGSAFTIEPTAAGRQIMKANGFEFSIPSITVEGANVDESKTLAYKKMYDVFRQKGLTIKYAQEMRRKDLLEKTRLGEYYEGVELNTANKHQAVYKGRKYTVQQLVGIKKGQRTVISTAIFAEGSRTKAVGHLLKSAPETAARK